MDIPELLLIKLVLTILEDGYSVMTQEFLIGDIISDRTKAASSCRDHGNSMDYQLLYFHNLEDFDKIDRKLNRTFNVDAEIWTDLYVLNATALKSQVTGNEYNFQIVSSINWSPSYVVLIWRPGELSLKKSNCVKGCVVICREVTTLNSTSVSNEVTMDRFGATLESTEIRSNGTMDTSSQNCSVCSCNTRTFVRMTSEEVRGVVNRIRKNLTVVKTNLSSSVRKRISASDPRMSSQIIGMTLGVSILSFVGSLLVIPDIITFLKFVMSRVCC